MVQEIKSQNKGEFPVAERISGVGEYYFAGKLRQIEELNARGKKVINLGIGSPDMPPHPSVTEVLHSESLIPNQHGYQNYKGHVRLREAVASWYLKYYGVTLDPAFEILPLIGSKEGIMHICMSYINPGDKVLIPNPGYPTYTSAAKIAGAEIEYYKLSEANHFEPDFDKLESLDLSHVRLMFVNYPHMPTGKKASKELFEKIVDFARRHHILIVHDNPYSFILNDEPLSMLSVDGAKDVVIELNSLSKSHNMAGWRVGFAVGGQQRIQDVMRFKSNMDSGMFLPLQFAAAQALTLGEDWFASLNGVYKERREKVFELLDVLKADYSKNQAGLFVWAKVPQHVKSGYEISDQILEKANVFITPGGIFGDEGDSFIRISLCVSKDKLDEAIERIKKSDFQNI